MTLGLSFCCDVMGCDQSRRYPDPRTNTCNLTHEHLSGMNLWDCPEVKKGIAKARTEGRQQAAAELDRTAGQPLQTYIQKQSLVHILVKDGEQFHKERMATFGKSDEITRSVKYELEGYLNNLLKGVLSGTQLKEVEL